MMRTTRSYLAKAVLVALAGTCSVQAMATGVQSSTVPSRADLSTVLAAPRLSLEAVDRLYNAALLANGLEALTARVDAATQSGEPKARARALLVKAALSWRAGDLAGARAAITLATALDNGPDAALLKARIADASGEVDLATPYRAAQAAGADDAAVALRLATIGGLTRPSALAAYGAGLPADKARPVAIAVGLLGDPAAALKLYVPTTSGPGVVPDLLRVAEWALAARDFATARDRSWRAYRATTVVDDRRYALALLTEAYREQGDIAGAYTFLHGQPRDADVRQMELNLLIELRRYDAALAMASAPDAGALRERLPAILNLSGDRAGSVTEYRRLIAAQPRDPRWYGALAAIYMQDGQEAEARGIYDRFFTANRVNVPVLIEGARQMIAMGLDDPAIAMISSVANGSADGLAARRFLFDTFVARGDVARAAEQLQAMRAALPAGSPLLGQVAEGYVTIARRDDAIAVLLSMEGAGRALDYDQQVRLADLLIQADRQDEALARLRRLLPVTQLPARRNLIESRIVEVANASGNTDALATELDQRLAAGNLSEDQISLLMALRLSQNKYDEALAAMNRYVARSGGGEAARLRQLVSVYARLNKQAELAATLDRLIKIDPANRATHLRNRILGVVGKEGDAPAAERLAEIDRLLAELAKVEGEDAESHAFRAGVYGMAELNDRALAQTQAAYATVSSDTDALAQLVAAMKKVGKVRESVALLQFEGETAQTTRSFVGVLDAVLDALVDADPSLADVALDWALRHAIERVAIAGADPALIGRVADLAESRADPEMQLRALDATLPTAGEQRASVLRQLVTLTSGSAIDGQAQTFGDVRRRIVYGRRLLALQRLFPPSFYGELGEAMLAVGDPAGADTAFAMMSDIGNVLNVDAIRGEAYARRGYPDAALRTFVSAMLKDQNNLDLVIKASILREQNGQAALAAPWYWRSLRSVIARQPVLAADAVPDNQVDIERIVPQLVEGLLLTLSANPATEAEVGRDLRAMLNETAERSLRGKPRPLADYGRLRLISQVGRRIAEVRGDASLIGAIDAVAARLPDGARAVVADTDLPQGPMAALMRQAADVGNTRLADAINLGEDHADRLRQRVATALGNEERGRANVTEFGPSEGAGEFVILIADLAERLSPDQVRTLLIEPLQASRFRQEILFDLLNILPDRYTLMQKIAGRPLLTDEELVKLATRPSQGTGYSVRDIRRVEASPFAWIADLPPERQLAIYDGLVTQAEGGRGFSLLGSQALEDLFSKPLDATMQARLLPVIVRDIAVPRDPAVKSARFVLRNFMLLDAAAANRPFAVSAARKVAERYPDGKLLPEFLTAWYAGDKTAAYRLMLSLAKDAEAASYDNFVTDLGKRYFAAEQQARIDAFMQTPSPTVEEATQFYTAFVANRNDPKTPVADYLRKLLSIDPGNQQYLIELMWRLWSADDKDAFVAELRGYLRRHPEDRGAASVLAFTELGRGRSSEAQAVATANGFSIDDPVWVTRMLNRASQRGGAEAGPTAMFPAVYGAFEKANPDAPVVIALQKRAGTAARFATGTVEQQAVSQFTQSALERPETAAGALRSLWRRSAVPGAESSSWSALNRAEVVDALDTAMSADGGADAARLRAVMARPEILAELENYVTALGSVDPGVAERVYGWLIDGIVTRGAADARLDSILPRLTAGPVGTGDLRLATRLADRTARVLSPEQLGAMATQLDAMSALSFRDRVAAARVFARGGDTGMATAMLRAATLQMLYAPLPNPFQQDDADLLAGALSAWADQAAARTVYAGIAELFAQRQKAGQIAPKLTLPPFAGDASGG